MPSAVQCVNVARLAALVAGVNATARDAEQIAEAVYGIHKVGQTLLTLYEEAMEAEVESPRRERRIAKLEERVREAAKDLGLVVEFQRTRPGFHPWPLAFTVQEHWKGGQGTLGARLGEHQTHYLGGRS